jgi:hypothetical protein
VNFVERVLDRVGGLPSPSSLGYVACFVNQDLEKPIELSLLQDALRLALLPVG